MALVRRLVRAWSSTALTRLMNSGVGSAGGSGSSLVPPGFTSATSTDTFGLVQISHEAQDCVYVKGPSMRARARERAMLVLEVCPPRLHRGSEYHSCWVSMGAVEQPSLSGDNASV